MLGCSAGQDPGASSTASSRASRASSGAAVATSTSRPKQETVCRSLTVPDVVARVEPQVVTVRTGHGLGSGIVYRDHVVITDAHVVARAEGSSATVSGVQVLLADGSTRSGKVIGSDQLTDVALVRVEGAALPSATFRTALPEPGEAVLAVGSPLGFSSTATKGIISALGRNLPAQSSGQPPLVDLIQTDAPISPGNSGGALVDVCGQVVGVNEAYIPPSSGAVSLGFATPALVATGIADQLLGSGKVTHPSLGVEVTNLTPSIAKALSTNASNGVVVISADSSGPAASAGVEKGDVITSLHGQSISGYAELLGALRELEPGDEVDLVVDRRGTEKTLTVTVGSRS